jgi:hypothetical protein
MWVRGMLRNHCSLFSDVKSSLPSIEKCILQGKGTFFS